MDFSEFAGRALTKGARPGSAEDRRGGAENQNTCWLRVTAESQERPPERGRFLYGPEKWSPQRRLFMRSEERWISLIF